MCFGGCLGPFKQGLRSSYALESVFLKNMGTGFFHVWGADG